MELSGKTILITRAASQSAELRSRLEDLGARVIECPTIQIVPPKTWKPVDDAIRRLNTYQWLLFTSANAVEQFMDRMGNHRPTIPIAVVGSATAGKLEDWGLKPALVPQEFRAEGLLAAFSDNLVGTRILFPRAEVARELLPEELRRRGATLAADRRLSKSAASVKFSSRNGWTVSFLRVPRRFPMACTRCQPAPRWQ